MSAKAEVSIELRDNPACSRGLIVAVNGDEVAEATYNDHGWSGIDALERTVVVVARACGHTVTDRRTR